MKKLAILLMIFVLTGCYSSKWEHTLMVEGHLYVTTEDVVMLNIDLIRLKKSERYAEITSTVTSTSSPTQNGEANFGTVGTPYLKFDDDYVYVRLNHEWILFKKMAKDLQ